MTLDEVMADFRRNGREVDLDLEIGNETKSDAEQLLYGLIHKQQRRFEREIKLPHPYEAFSKSTIALYSVSNKTEGTANRSRSTPNYRKYMLEYQSHTWDSSSTAETRLTKGFATKPAVRGQPYRAENVWSSPSAVARRAVQDNVLRPIFGKSPMYSNCQQSFLPNITKHLSVNTNESRDGKPGQGCNDKENTFVGRQPSKKSYSQTVANNQIRERTVSVVCRSFVSKAAPPTTPMQMHFPQPPPPPPPPLQMQLHRPPPPITTPPNPQPRGRAPGSALLDAPTVANAKSCTKARGIERCQENSSIKVQDGKSNGEKSATPPRTFLAAVMSQRRSSNGAAVFKDKARSGASGLPQASSSSPSPSSSPKTTDHFKAQGGVSNKNASATFKLVEGSSKEHFSRIYYSNTLSPKGAGGFGAVSRNGRTRRSRDNSQSDNRPKECAFCRTNGETPATYRTHVLKDEYGRTVCAVLRKYVCPLCGATGENAHTVKYCPKNSNPPMVSMMTTLKSMRSSTGTLRVPHPWKLQPGGQQPKKSFACFSF